MPILPESAKNIVLPKMVPVKQIFPDDRIADVPAVIAAQFAREEIRASVEAGKTAAVLCGSRGISQIDLVTKCVIDNLKALGVEPFIVPAMGRGADRRAGRLRHYRRNDGRADQGIHGDNHSRRDRTGFPGPCGQVCCAGRLHHSDQSRQGAYGL